ncbi:glutaredoxin [bacterium BMS3Bbin11]|nr:glutaredoxin [bacterium BMS3Abin11]GBE45578.1 glutaredoxin [bacterium BMS3Bbin11]HDH07942.1 glutaredoxin family protein [Gammaproteobacteria bacterium]
MKKINRFTTCYTALLLLFSFAIFPAVADELYKWVDNKGNVTYQSSPPPGTAKKVERPNISTGNSAASDQVEAAQHEEKDLKPVKFYYKPECSSCEEARAYFDENTVPFVEIDLSENEAEAEKLEKKLGVISVPIFGIGDKYVSGFEKNMLNKLLVNEGYDLPAEIND